MVYYNRIVVSEGYDVNKSSAFKECIICHFNQLLATVFMIY